MSNQSATADETFMRQALDLAVNGRGLVEPNPLVGCVIVREGRVIGAGYHRKFGLDHAEPDALGRCTQSPAGATAYVTLEPCCHVGKKTPPCVPRLVAAGIERVVVGCVDPNPAVAGEGVRQLRAAGVVVDVGVLEGECRQLNAAFFSQVRRGRPYVTLKWAQSADGKVAGPRGRRVWISNETSRSAVHAMRACCDAILVGVNTVLADDPLLTVRHVPTVRPLMRLVGDRDLRIPLTSQLVCTASQGAVVVFCAEQAVRDWPGRVEQLQARGVEVKGLPTDASGMISLPHLLDDLGRRAVTHLVVEPGPTLAGIFIQQGLADRVWVFYSPNSIGDATAPAAVQVPYPQSGEVELAGDRLVEYLNPQGGVFYAIAPSADIVRISQQ